MMSRTTLLTLAGVCVLAAGCSADIVDVDDASPANQAQGLVIVERGAAVGAATARTQVSARFLRATGLDAETAEQVVGLSRALPPLGTCARGVAEQQSVQVRSSGSIELLDVGDVFVQAAGGPSVVLAPRAFPDVGDLVSGVVYTSRDETAEVAPGVGYLIETTGSTRIDAFSSRADAPEAPDGVTLAGLPLDSDEFVLASGAALRLRWNAGRRSDTIYVELRWDGAEPVHCAFADAGSAEIPGSYARPEGAHTLGLAVHRLRRTALRFEGDARPSELAGGTVEFDFATLADVVLADGAALSADLGG